MQRTVQWHSSARRLASALVWTLIGSSTLSAQLNLPYTGSGNNSTYLFQLTQNGTGAAIKLFLANSSATQPALFVQTVAPGPTIFGRSLATSGFTYGARFEAQGPQARGVLGYALSTTGASFGVYGLSDSVAGTGVFGWARATSGTTYGVYGQVSSPNGYAGYFVGRGYFSGNVGIGTSSPSAKLHVQGTAYFNGNVGIGTGSPSVRLSLGGDNANTKLAIWDGGTSGVMGFGVGPAQFRIHLNNSGDRFSFLNAPNGTEIVTIRGSGNVGIGTSSPSAKLHLVNGNLRVDGGEFQSWGPITLHPDVDNTGDDVVRFVDSTGNETMRVQSDGKVGIGTSEPQARLHGQGDGVFTGGVSLSGSRFGYTLFAADSDNVIAKIVNLSTTADPSYTLFVENRSPGGTVIHGLAFYGGIAVSGFSTSADNSIGVRGEASGYNSYGVYCVGAFAVTGNKSFQIDHPLSPETHFLNHFCTEAPEPLNAYSGNVVTDAQGYAVVQLPDYFEAINRDFRYQLTVIGQFAQAIVAEEIRGNRFVIRTDKPHVKVSWRVEATRNDPWVQRCGFQTEQEKPKEYQGKYLHPELYGQPKERGIFHYLQLEPSPAEPTRP